MEFFDSISWLLIWMVCWFGWWSILYIRLPTHNDYIFYAERDIAFFFAGTFIWLIFLPRDIWLMSLMTLLLLGAICTGLGTYLWFQKKHGTTLTLQQKENLKKFISNPTNDSEQIDWQELNPRYLFVKAIEVLFQQLGIIALWHSIVTGFIPTFFNDHILTLMFLFTLVHIPMLLFQSWKSARTFIIASIFGSFIFGLIFKQFGYTGITLSYIFHIFFYVSLPDISGLFTSVGKNLMRKK